MVSASTAASPQSLLFGWLENLSKKTHIDYHAVCVCVCVCVCYLLGACCLGGEKTWESKGNIYIYIYILILVCFFYYIHDFEFFFFFAWFLGAKKMWESKEK